MSSVMSVANPYNRKHPHRSSTVVCVGAGISAIALGARLKLSYGFDDVAFYERDGDLGGTWHANSYPGAACDIPTALYSFSFAQNPEWTVLHPESWEIKAYLQRVAAEYGITRKTTFRSEVFGARWDDDTCRWYVDIRNSDSGEEFVHECKILISAIGVLATPNVPEIPGQGVFKGKTMHSARWDDSVALTGKRVALLGNGCTAAQIVPSIAPKVGHLTQFIRSKHWIQAGPQVEYTPTILWVLKNLPLAQRLHRLAIFLIAEYDYRLQGSSQYSVRQRAAKMKSVEAYMRRKAPKEYHDILIPDFQIGCRRRIIDPVPSYLTSLHRPNVNLTDERVVELTPNGIRTPEREYPVDVIVYATGFNTSEYMGTMDIRGRGGESIHEHWKRQGGVGAYNCTAINGFPNYFMLLGPNTLTGHTSCIIASENTANYALKVLKPVLDGYATKVEVKAEAEVAYISRLQAALKSSIFQTGGCSTWYRDKSGWNATIYPWSQLHFTYSCLFVKERDWITTYIHQPVTPKLTASLSPVYMITPAYVLVVFGWQQALIALLTMYIAFGPPLEVVRAIFRMGRGKVY